MNEDIPSPCDLVVVGTGLTESIIAAAASRIGKQVVHLDHRDYYGGNWASFSLNSLQNFLTTSAEDIQHPAVNVESQLLHLNVNVVSGIHNVCQRWHINETSSPETRQEQNLPQDAPQLAHQVWTRAELERNSRKFNFDLSPKVLFARGEMVEVLINSGICRYAEFKNVTNIYTYDCSDKNLINVPCSRADVFNSKTISVVEKRLLMKVLTMCVEYEKNQESLQCFESGSFGDFLTANKIVGKIRRYVIDTVAMTNESTDFRLAVKKVQKFVRSIGRYGNTPFLWTMYGSGELPQCFCRCSAVFGGVYCLKRNVQGILTNSVNRAVGVVSENQTIATSFVVIEDSFSPKIIPKNGISRAILVTNKALTANDQVTLINYPACGQKEAIRILELSASAMACPRGLFVVHLVTSQIETAQEDFKDVIDNLFASDGIEESDKPNILWSVHFNMNEYETAPGSLPSNVFSCPGPSSSLDIDQHVVDAKRIFESIFPGEEFLPRVPDPEDIIIEEPSEETTEMNPHNPAIL